MTSMASPRRGKFPGRLVVIVTATFSCLLCGCSGPGDAGSDAADATVDSTGPSPAPGGAPSSSATPTVAPTPVRVPVYPDDEAQDRAFVSEVAPLESWPATSTVTAASLQDWADSLAQAGRSFCTAGTTSATVQQLDTIDEAAFQLAAAGTYCPERLADMGAGVVLSGPVVPVDVESSCPETPEEIPVVVTSFDATYGADWSATVTNNSGYDALIRVDVLENSNGVSDEYAGMADEYAGEWTESTEFSDSMYEPFLLKAGESRSATGGTTSTVYDWAEPSFRIENDFYIPLGCTVTSP